MISRSVLCLSMILKCGEQIQGVKFATGGLRDAALEESFKISGNGGYQMWRAPKGWERTVAVMKLGRGDENGCGICSDCRKGDILMLF